MMHFELIFVKGVRSESRCFFSLHVSAQLLLGFFWFVLVTKSCLTLFDIPGKNIGVDCHFLLQGIFLTQGSNLLSPAVAGFSTAEPVVSVPFL